MGLSRRPIKLAHLALLIILVVAGCLRFCSLGKMPLNNEEARSALSAALGTSHASNFAGADHLSPSQPAYETLTRLVFEFFGASDSSARLIPALAGLLMVAAPMLAWRMLGLPTALLWSFLLAISPVFVTTSRTASAASLAGLGWMIAAMAWLGMRAAEQDRTRLLLGAFGMGFALASGAQGITGMLILALAALLWKGASLLIPENPDASGKKPVIDPCFLWVIPGVVIVLATGAGSSLEGLARFFEAVAEWIQGWWGESPYPIASIVAMLPAYSPLLFLFGCFAILSAFRTTEKEALFASLLGFVAFMVVILYPSRRAHDLLWILLPLSYLASRFLVRLLEESAHEAHGGWSLGLGAILFIFLMIAGMQWAAVPGEYAAIDPLLRFQRSIALWGFCLAIFVLFGLGWGWRDARRGALWALAGLAMLLSIAGLWRLNYGENAFSGRELWRAQVSSAGLPILVRTLERTSQMNTGISNGLPIQFLREAPPGLAWALRDQRRMPRDLAGEDSTPPIVLAPEWDEELNLRANYIGQTLAIGERWGWETPIPPDFLKWWLTKSAPVSVERWILLVREDIAFLGTDME